MLDRLHVLAIGPGLGRNKIVLDIVAHVIEKAVSKDIPYVLVIVSCD